MEKTFFKIKCANCGMIFGIIEMPYPTYTNNNPDGVIFEIASEKDLNYPAKIFCSPNCVTEYHEKNILTTKETITYHKKALTTNKEMLTNIKI